MGYGIYTMRETHIPRGRRAMGILVSLMVYMPYPMTPEWYKVFIP